MMEFDAERVWVNVRQASDEDLLERCTVYRNGMEPEALEIIAAELERRGIEPARIVQYAAAREAVIERRGLPLKCSFCERGAVREEWRWHRLWGVLPVFPRRFRLCERHA